MGSGSPLLAFAINKVKKKVRPVSRQDVNFMLNSPVKNVNFYGQANLQMVANSFSIKPIGQMTEQHWQ